MNPEEQLAKWQQKIGSSMDLTAEYTKRLKDFDGDSQKALQKIHAKVARQLNSSALSFTGVVIAKSDPVDYNAYKWKKASKMFAENPTLAMSGEYDKNGKLTFKTDDKGTPLDVIEKWPSGDPNRNYLTPIAKFAWTKEIDGVAALTKPDPNTPNKADTPMRFTLSLRGELADPASPAYFNPPDGVPIEFKALDKTKKEDNVLRLGGAKATKYTLSNAKLPTLETITQTFFKDNFVPAHEIVDTFQRRGRSLVIVEGYVISMNREPNQKTGNRIVQITTMEMEDADQKVITGWVPKDVKMEFAEESEVRIIGVMDRRPVYEEGKRTEELGEVTINVRAIQVLHAEPIPPVESFDPTKFQQMPPNFMTGGS